MHHWTASPQLSLLQEDVAPVVYVVRLEVDVGKTAKSGVGPTIGLADHYRPWRETRSWEFGVS